MDHLMPLRRRLALAAIAVIAFATTLANPAFAGPGDPIAVTVEGSASASSALAAAALPGSCTLNPENPHWSKSTGGVISKGWLSCTVDASITIQSSIYRGPQIGPGTLVRSSSEVKGVPAGGSVRVWMPREGLSGAPCTNGKYYQTFITLSAYGGTIASGSSNKVQVNNCG